MGKKSGSWARPRTEVICPREELRVGPLRVTPSQSLHQK
jgi:hypothetical protein